jgi:Fe2+ or Zn2+ uptake regulation protein
MENIEPHGPKDAAWRDFVVRHMNDIGIRVTPTRVAVLVSLFEMKQGVKADEIYKFASRKGLSLSQASIYRNLVDFERVRIVSRQWTPGEAGARATFFLQCPRQPEKMHMISCRKCGRRVKFRNPDFTDMVRTASQSSLFGSSEQAINISIICGDCE